MDIKIITVQHKTYFIPEDTVYYPIFVGKYNTSDNSGDNISNKNDYYSELTALYWAWKNLKCEYLGLCHYRRYFIKNKLMFLFKKNNAILNKKNYEHYLLKYDMLLPKKEHYIFDSVRSQYVREHGEEELNLAGEIISKKYPAYINSFEQVLLSKSFFICNMFVTKKIIADRYCKWLFDILFELENVLKNRIIKKRIFGYLSERLFNVWLLNEHLNIKEINMINIESPKYNIYFERY